MHIQDYYRQLGLHEDAWHIGPEHPGLEDLALRVIRERSSARFLELGVQAGGFAVPVILATWKTSGFHYTGVDNLEYTNAVPLRLLENYLRQEGVSAPMRFVEGDSTSVLQTAAAESFDFILLDHYKPKYPIDLYLVCSRNLLSDGGVMILHDVLTHAAPDWEVCRDVCRAFGFEWEIHGEVSQGAAVVWRKRGYVANRLHQAGIGARVRARWSAHAAVLQSRRAVGRALRSWGLRQ